MANNDSGGSFVVGFLVGGILGAVVGILLAPKSGAETRADLAEQSEIWRTRAEEVAATLRERVGPAVEGMRERVGPAVEGMRERVGPAVESLRERVGPVMEQVSARVGRSGQAPHSDGEHEGELASAEDGDSPKKDGEEA